ncbi:thiamine pyrophosphate-binding protein [Actinoplanes sp. NPDC023936]|uniref:thiamine pyrophosphate-binding protein n=1 Tax=Actinoplanes sp. NPDC023936 TaxID=3154910 RepID=UPI0033EEA3D7
MDVGEAIVRNLGAIGVDTVFGGAGEANASMLLSLRSATTKTVIVRNEQGAAFMACGYAMFSDRLGVCFATAGPGEFNLLSGLAVALSDSLPVLAISAFTPARWRGKGALNEASGLHRTPDSWSIFAATTKRSFLVEDPGTVIDVLEQAVRLAFEGRPGPVHLQVPTDVFRMPVPAFRTISVAVDPVPPAPQAISEAAETVATVVRDGETLVLIGYGAVRSHAADDLLAFVERFQVPFATTMDAKGILPESHPLSAGVLGTAGDPAAAGLFDDARVVIAFGNSFAQNATFEFSPDLFDGKDLVHVNIDPAEIGKVYRPRHGIVADVRPAVRALSAALGERVGSIPERRWEMRKHADAEVAGGSRIHPALLVRELNRLLPERAIVLGDAGGHMLWLNAYLRLSHGQIYQNPGSFGPMASNVNGAIGVRAANPDRHVIVGCGDGAYLMAGFELLTAVAHNLPVVWVIFNNGGFNVIKQFQLMHFHETAFTDFADPDFAAYARACGAHGARVERLPDFAGAFTEALASGRPAVIDVLVDAEVYPPYEVELPRRALAGA